MVSLGLIWTVIAFLMVSLPTSIQRQRTLRKGMAVRRIGFDGDKAHHEGTH